MSTGLWKRDDVPHKGWVWVDMRDLGEPTETCEMCQVQLIRFVHVMYHEEWPRTLEVGCVCAGHMSEDLERARTIEREFKSLVRRKEAFLTRRWTLRYNPSYDSYLQYINIDGFHISVWGKEDGSWAGKIVDPNQVAQYSKTPYKSMEEVKAAAFDTMEKIKAKKKEPA